MLNYSPCPAGVVIPVSAKGGGMRAGNITNSQTAVDE